MTKRQEFKLEKLKIKSETKIEKKTNPVFNETKQKVTGKIFDSVDNLIDRAAQVYNPAVSEDISNQRIAESSSTSLFVGSNQKGIFVAIILFVIIIFN